MTARGLRIGFLGIGLAWVGLGLWTLAEGDIGAGIVKLMLAIGWLLIAAYCDRLQAFRKGSRVNYKSDGT